MDTALTRGIDPAPGAVILLSLPNPNPTPNPTLICEHSHNLAPLLLLEPARASSGADGLHSRAAENAALNACFCSPVAGLVEAVSITRAQYPQQDCTAAALAKRPI